MTADDNLKKQLKNELIVPQYAQMQIIEANLREVKNSLQESEERYYTIFNNSIDAIFLTDPNGGICAANPEACRIFGWTEEEFCGIGRNGVVDITDTRLQAAIDERNRTGKFKGELTYIRKDGTKFPGEVSTALFKDKDGACKTSMIIRDVTERKQVEDELRQTNALMKLFIQKTNRKEYLDAVLILLREWVNCRCIGIRILDEDGYIPYESYVGFSQEFWESENWLSVNNNQCACIRVVIEKPEPQDEICMTKVGSFYCNNIAEFVAEMSEEEQSRYRIKCVELGFKSVAIIPVRFFDRVLGAIHLADEKEGKLPLKLVEFIEKVSPLIGEAVHRFNLEDELRHKNSNLEKIVKERTQELKLANEKLKQDISEQKRLEEKLKKANQQVTEILNSITDAFFTLDNEWRFTYLNTKAAQTSEEQIIGKNIWECFPQLINTELYDKYYWAMKNKVDVHFETVGYNNKATWYEVHVYPSQDGISVYFRDITERKQIEKRLRLSEERFFKAFNFSPASMTIYSLENTKFIDVNKNCLKMHGYSRDEIVGRSVQDLDLWVDAAEFNLFLRDIREKGFANNHEIRSRKKSGQIFTALMSGVVIDLNGERCVLTIKNDITELRQYQKEILRLDRLNLIGEMAAGIAHEIRNPMTTVKGFLQMLSQKDRYQQDQHFFNLMIEEVNRANSIITEFLSLSKNRMIEFKMQSLHSTLDSLFPLIQADAFVSDKNVILELNKIPDLLLDEKEIRQLVLNLSRNGLEAMPSGEFMTIKTYLDNNKVVLSVQDRGKGIPSDIFDKIGTPFFTTKENGTGLGLATCYSIAARHNACIDFETGPEGTTFYVRFKVNT